MSASDWISALALAIAILTAGGSSYGWRHSKFRYGEVLTWSLEVIRAMQRLQLLLRRDHKNNSGVAEHRPEFDREVRESSEAISILAEQGRVFFKNSPGRGALRGWGAGKPPAYRGVRPRVLDYLVACYDAADDRPSADRARRKDLLDAVLEAERQFVSLARCEVGRAGSLSVRTREAGQGSPLDGLLEDLRKREGSYARR